MCHDVELLFHFKIIGTETMTGIINNLALDDIYENSFIIETIANNLNNNITCLYIYIYYILLIIVQQ